MKLGIVGSEAAKFTRLTEQGARMTIRRLFTPDIELVVSGGCHLGGIDVWAIEEALASPHIRATQEFTAPARQWSGPGGYAERNLRIAQVCDKVVCITVRELPSGYRGMRFEWCYHCKTGAHVKSGGCWTIKEAKKLGKSTELIVI